MKASVYLKKGRKTLRFADTLREVLVRRSGMFDEAFYYDTYPDVAVSGMSALQHYCRFGWREGRRPGPKVQPRSFATSKSGTFLRGGNPVVRWMLLGRWLGLSLSWPELRSFGCGGQRLVFVLHEASRTGAPIFAVRLARWLRSVGCEPSFVLLDDGSLLPQLWQEFDCLPLFALAPSERRAAMEEHLAACDLLYMNSIASLAVLRSLPNLSCGTLLHVHESVAYARGWTSELERLAKKRPALITVDRESVCFLEKCLGVTAQVVPPAIESGHALRTPPARPRVVGCGTMSYRKGADLFCHVAQRLLSRFDVEILWIGGPGEIDMEALLKELGLKGRVTLTGEVDDVRSILRDSSVLLLTSREDPFPLVALEAASCAVPVICFDTMQEGVGTWVSAGAGIVIPSLDVDGMAEAVFSLLQSCERQSLGENAYAIAQQYTIDAIGPRIAAVINERAGRDLVCDMKSSAQRT